MLKTKVDGVVLTVADGDVGDAAEYYFYFDMAGSGFDGFSMEHIITATTLTYEATNGAEWHDVTQDLTGGSVSSFTTTGYCTVASPVPWARLRVKAVTTNATNALILALTRIRL